MVRRHVVTRFARLRFVRIRQLSVICIGLALRGGIGSMSQTPSVAPTPQLSNAFIPTTSDSVTAFVDVTVIPMNEEQVLPGQTVLVQGGRIVAVGSPSKVHVPDDAVRIDGHKRYLIPGLADMHIHLGANGGDSVSAERALFLLLANGITTVRNMDYRQKGTGEMGLDNAFLLRLRARAASGELVSPRIYTSGAWGPPEYITGGRPQRLDSIAVYVAAYKAAGYDFVKIHDEDSIVAESVLVAAYRLGIPVVGHPRLFPVEKVFGETPVPSAPEGRLPLLGRVPSFSGAAAKTGYKSVEHLLYYYYANQESPDPLQLARRVEETKRGGVWNCPTLNSIEELHISPHNAGIIISALKEAGAGLLSGTDACASTMYGVPGPSLHQELQRLVLAGLTPYEALETSTRNVAVFFGTLAESGTVEVGKRADLVLLDGNPLEDITNSSNIAGVMIGGRWFSHDTLAPRLAKEMAALGGGR